MRATLRFGGARSGPPEAALNLSISAEMKVGIESIADAADWSLATVARDALTRGLPLTRDSLRKKSRQSKGKSANRELDRG